MFLCLFLISTPFYIPMAEARREDGDEGERGDLRELRSRGQNTGIGYYVVFSNVTDRQLKAVSCLSLDFLDRLSSILIDNHVKKNFFFKVGPWLR